MSYIPSGSEQVLIDSLDISIGGKAMFALFLVGKYVIPFIVAGVAIGFLYVICKAGFDSVKMKENALDNAKMLVILAIVFFVGTTWSTWCWFFVRTGV